MLPKLNRRQFVAGLISVPVVGLLIPKGLLGNPAGGFYAPVPTDIEPYVQWLGERRMPNQMGSMMPIVAYAAWAPPGATLAEIQTFGGTTTISDLEARLAQRGLVEEKKRNLLENMRECMEAHHDPGWFRATESVWGTNAEGEPEIVETRHVWKRAGYVRWLKPGELSGGEIRIAS